MKSEYKRIKLTYQKDKMKVCELRSKKQVKIKINRQIIFKNWNVKIKN